MITRYHAKYYAQLLSQKSVGNNLQNLSQSLLNSAVDINPHQIDAALFAFKSPLSKGVVLADEVGLGKTIEAGLVLCQMWSTGKRKIIIVCPASLRKQWSFELAEKFGIASEILDAKVFNAYVAEGKIHSLTIGLLSAPITLLQRRRQRYCAMASIWLLWMRLIN